MAYNQAIYRNFCCNCSKEIIGYKNEETGMIKFVCTRCGYAKTSKLCGRGGLKSREKYPRGGVVYGEEKDFVPEEDEIGII